MNILVTGGSGFVGSKVIELLNKSKQLHNQEYQEHNVENYDLPEKDLMDFKTLEESIKRNDVVVHIAAIANLYDTHKDPEQTFRVNIEATYYLAQYCKKHKKELVYISTCCAYGPHTEPLATENIRANPVEFYARSKYIAEYLVAEVEGVTTLRLGTVLGPNMRPALFNYKVMDKLRNNKKISLYGDGSASRNYIYVDDLAEGIVLAVEKRPSGIINLCGDEITDLDEVLMVAQQVTGIQGEWEYAPPRDMGDYPENIDNSKAFETLGWRPKTCYKKAMELTWEWMNEHL